MDLGEKDYIVSAEVVNKDGLMLSVSEFGFGKRTELDEYRLTGRGGKGVINMKVTNKTGPVVGALCVAEESDLMIITQDGKMIRIESAQIRAAGRATQGVRLVKMDEGDRVAAASVIPDSEVAANGTDGQEELPLQ
jgi:DNA gyrase subunit A